jgi:uncharacterized protein YndB with AHSA1/START domain
MTVHQHFVDGRPALRLTRHLEHSVERVWRAVSDPAELARWFVSETTWTPAVGETFEAGGAAVLVTEVTPPHVLAWTWGEEVYRFELSAQGEGCMLVFTHVFTPAFGPDWQHAAGWDAYFNRLDALLAGGFLSEEDAHVGMDAVLAHYRQAFAATGA